MERPASSELVLQEVVRTNPQLLPADDLGFDADLAVVGRETTLASGAIDLVCMARTGDLVLVEFKTGPQNPDFRHALAQVLDYGSDLWRLSVDEFDRGVVQRYLAGPHSGGAGQALQGLEDVVENAGWNLQEIELESLRTRLDEVLETGDFTFVVAAQRFTSTMVATVDYLNAATRYGRYFLVEIIQLEGEDLRAHAAQVVAAPPRVTGHGGGTGKVDEEEFLAALPDPAFREAMRDVLAATTALGLIQAWGSRGTSIRLPTPDRSEPLSIGWAFPDGHSWSSARHLTLGVDPNSLSSTPTVRGAVETYLRRLATIPGGKAVVHPQGLVFSPEIVPLVSDELIRVITQLVDDVRPAETSEDTPAVGGADAPDGEDPPE
ncbi:hypothetical protein [Ornithinimicrobium sp. LYQ103]|uniref:hypothetical protein n=1 Tax=Ornithinimicrobium sp. LYQ103 TaxID=3378796 RepID=UPI00386211B8